MELYLLKDMKRGINRIEGELYRHIFKVMRKKEGDVIYLTNGVGTGGEGVVLEVNKNYALVNVENLHHRVKEGIEITLAFPVLKGERSEFIIEKSTELGVDVLVPVIFERSVVKDVKKNRLNRWRRIMESAAMQSLRYSLPVLSAPVSLKEFIMRYRGDIFYGFIESNNFNINISGDVAIVIGPEGDFSEDEIKLLKENGRPFSLGRNRLRAETAAVVSAFLFSFEVYKNIKRKEVK